MNLMPIMPRPLYGRRILVTGAGGFLGSHLVEHLLREGAQVGALDRVEGKLAKIECPQPFTFMQCNLANPSEALAAILSFEPQILFHLAAHPDGPEDFTRAQMAIQQNLALTLHALEGFRRCGGELFIYGDSSKVYGDGAVPYCQKQRPRPLSSYAIAKAAGWEFCQLYGRVHGVACVSIRPTMLYGPRQGVNLFAHVVNCVLRHQECIELAGGDQTRDPLFIEDAVSAYLRVARLGPALAGQVINIGGGDERTVQQLAQCVVEMMGASTRIAPAAHSRRSPERPRSYCDNMEARQLIQWRPLTDLRRGLRLTIQDLTARLSSDPLASGRE